MTITREELRKKIIEFIEQDPNVQGYHPYIAEFVEENNLCPIDVSKVLHELGSENYRLKDGRIMIHHDERQYYLSREYADKIYAHKYLHTGELNCIKHSEVSDG